MLLIPAIDIKNNNCVRLKKGKIKNINIFSKNPIIIINKWLNFNIKRIHLVDLDGAFLGKPKNILSIKSIINYINGKTKIQLGGGIRNIETIDYYLSLGVSNIVLGTKALIDLDFFKEVCQKYNEKIILALDIKNLKIAIKGWKEYYNLNIIKFLNKIKEFEFESFIYTDINRDGTQKGLNIENFFRISKNINKPVIISGGLNSRKEIKNLFSLQYKKLLGVICGTSIYLGALNFNNINNKINYLNKFFIE